MQIKGAIAVLLIQVAGLTFAYYCGPIQRPYPIYQGPPILPYPISDNCDAPNYPIYQPPNFVQPSPGGFDSSATASAASDGYDSTASASASSGTFAQLLKAPIHQVIGSLRGPGLIGDVSILMEHVLKNSKRYRGLARQIIHGLQEKNLIKTDENKLNQILGKVDGVFDAVESGQVSSISDILQSVNIPLERLSNLADLGSELIADVENADSEDES